MMNKKLPMLSAKKANALKRYAVKKCSACSKNKANRKIK